MSDLSLSAKMSPEGRVVIPAPIRKRLNIRPGDVVLFEVHEERVEIVSAAHLVDLMWANNAASGDIDSASLVRQERLGDQMAELAAEERDRQSSEEPYDAAEAAARLLSTLGLE